MTFTIVHLIFNLQGAEKNNIQHLAENAKCWAGDSNKMAQVTLNQKYEKSLGLFVQI